MIDPLIAVICVPGCKELDNPYTITFDRVLPVLAGELGDAVALLIVCDESEF